MKALTVKQPWASLICSGIKDVENRTWSTKFRGRILIHAAMKPLKFDDAVNYMSIEMLKQAVDFHWSTDHVVGVIMGSVEIVDCVVNHPSIWAEATDNHRVIWNWVLANPILFKEPIPAKGALSLWWINIDVCHICGQRAEYPCENCDEYFCDKHSAKFDQFTQIDYNCCSACQDNMKNHDEY